MTGDRPVVPAIDFPHNCSSPVSSSPVSSSPFLEGVDCRAGMGLKQDDPELHLEAIDSTNVFSSRIADSDQDQL
ncbi:hypothetical protein [Leptolyngbya sp. 'hensonii']|uniref:hypothetical protein n=1 Tax=Leptolyngbya sp. 'hensonii' TaxID=1922337 RepID=UPI000ACD864D|nr:hypothetical protein [Leptolyngbya sp. 'hensonii']